MKPRHSTGSSSVEQSLARVRRRMTHSVTPVANRTAKAFDSIHLAVSMSTGAGGGGSMSGRTRGIRVAVRVRPVTQLDANSQCDQMTVSGERKEVLLHNQTDPKKAKRFAFDSVFGTEASQEDVYRMAGVPELVESAVNGYHATVFAYGQTGSGKTYTMEGTKYIASAPSANSKFKRGDAAGPSVTADFDATPQDQVGVIPRAVDALFRAVDRESTSKRFSVKCSFVQIYKEQVYDLLNPLALNNPVNGKQQKEPAGFGQGKRVNPGAPAGFSGALRMRWSKTEDFYLENLFKCECQTAEELMDMFKSGVTNKVMASHKLNAQSSRSHCLFTIYIESSPMASPNEVISSRLTLVDLAGSERGSYVGANEGKIRDEGVAINKSLFTLRHVITTLTAAAEGGSTANMAHIPYRDSKLTSLLKNSLGGNSLTTMIACLAPLNAHYDENMSTLEYASRANRITNQVAVNEDPKSRIIRELRAENAFLRQQLAGVQTTQPGLASVLGSSMGAGNGSTCTSCGQPSSGGAGGGGGGGVNTGTWSGGLGDSATTGSQAQASQGANLKQQLEAAAAKLEPHESASLEELKRKLAESTQNDMDKVATKLLDAIGLIHKLSAVNQQLRSGYDDVCKQVEQFRIDNDSFQIENAELRDRLSIFEGMASLGEQQQQQAMEGANIPGHSADSPGGRRNSASHSPSHVEGNPYYTASSATYIELQELRKENALLHERLADAGLSPNPGGGNKGRSVSVSRGGPNVARRPISTGRSQSMYTRKNSPGPPAYNKLYGGSASGVPGSPMQNRGGAGRFDRAMSAYGNPYSPKAGANQAGSHSNLQRPVSHPDLSMNTNNGPGGKNLAEIHHQVTSRSLANNVRMSTVGQLLPNAQHQTAMKRGSHSSAEGESGGPSAKDPGHPGSTPTYTGPDDDPASKLQHLMSTRNALSLIHAPGPRCKFPN
eukprot:gene27733-7379_t